MLIETLIKLKIKIKAQMPQLMAAGLTLGLMQLFDLRPAQEPGVVLLYIDPGTGSMLFTIMIGILGALRYLFRTYIVKLRFLLSGGKQQKDSGEKLPLVIFSDDKRYWNIFKPICRELSGRNFPVVYMTASEDDPALQVALPQFHAQFIGKGNKAFAKLNFLKATIVFSTTPGLKVYQWKRSPDVDYYVHIYHSPNDATRYRMFGIDYYDAILVSGEYYIHQIRGLEKARHRPPKDIQIVGIPYMDEMELRLRAEGGGMKEKSEICILLAPSWGPAAILSKYGSRIIDTLLATGYKIIIRPHPQSFTSDKKILDPLMKQYPDNEQLSWNRDRDNFEVLRQSDILISDFSGVIFDYTLVYDKPIIYTETEFDNSIYDAWWLKEPLWTMEILSKLGLNLNENNMQNLKELIQTCLTDTRFAAGREQARKETWQYPGEGAKRTADYLIAKYQELTNGKEAETK